jgi:hypothetical protein
VGNFKQLGLDSEVRILDRQTFEKLKAAHERGEVHTSKDVLILMTKNEDGTFDKLIIYKDGMWTPDPVKVAERQLTGTAQDIEAAVKKAIDNATGDNSFAPIAVDQQYQALNNFEKAMWVIKAGKTFLDDLRIKEPYWDSALSDDNPLPFQVPDALAGGGNVAIDETKDISEMVVFGLSMFDPKTRQELVEGLRGVTAEQIVEALAAMVPDRAEEYTTASEEQVTYMATEDGIKIVMTVFAAKKLAAQLPKILKYIKNFAKVKFNRVIVDPSNTKTLQGDIGESDELADAFKDKPEEMSNNWEAVKDMEADTPLDPSVRRHPDAIKDPAATQNAIQILAGNKRPLTWDQIKALWKRGNDFNKKGRTKYGDNRSEIVLQKVGNNKAGKRVDAYIPGERIISRKACNVDEITESTWRSYCSELVNKYKVGTPLNSSKMPDEGPLNGRYTLEIPMSNMTGKKNMERFREIAAGYGEEGNKIEIIFLEE